MTKLSDHDIDLIIDSVKHSFKIAKGIRNRDQQVIYVTDYLKILLTNKSSGLKENVCNNCLGTGYNKKI